MENVPAKTNAVRKFTLIQEGEGDCEDSSLVKNKQREMGINVNFALYRFNRIKSIECWD